MPSSAAPQTVSPAICWDQVDRGHLGRRRVRHDAVHDRGLGDAVAVDGDVVHEPCSGRAEQGEHQPAAGEELAQADPRRAGGGALQHGQRAGGQPVQVVGGAPGVADNRGGEAGGLRHPAAVVEHRERRQCTDAEHQAPGQIVVDPRGEQGQRHGEGEHLAGGVRGEHHRDLFAPAAPVGVLGHDRRGDGVVAADADAEDEPGDQQPGEVGDRAVASAPTTMIAASMP
jgi:hypothetical protein